MRTPAALCVLPALFSLVSAEGGAFSGELRSTGVTANFTSPTGPRVDFSEPLTISWELPSDRSAREYEWSRLKLSFEWPEFGAGWDIADLDHHTVRSWTWEDPASFFESHVVGQSPAPTVANFTGAEEWKISAKLETPNGTDGTFGWFETNMFQIDGIEGYENDKSAGAALRPAAWVGATMGLLVWGSSLLV